MNHQPFETWLLDDKHLSAVEKRDLDAHIRVCRTCSALSETGLALRSAKVASPKAGFTVRFQQRLAAQKIVERRRRVWGMFVLIFSGLGLLSWFAAPFVISFLSAPIEWITTAVGYFLFIFTSLRVLGDFLQVITQILPQFIPPYAWMVLFSAMAGVGLAWAVSIWQFARKPQGVNA
jgi:hypothetical protein